MSPSGENTPSRGTDKTDKTPFRESVTDLFTFVPPDWKNPAKYPDPEKTSDKEWGWEFLRRNQEFWKDGREIHDLLFRHSGATDPNDVYRWFIKTEEQWKASTWTIGPPFQTCPRHPVIEKSTIPWHEEEKWEPSFIPILNDTDWIAVLKRMMQRLENKWSIPTFPYVTHGSPNSPFWYLNAEWDRARLISAYAPFDPSWLPPVPVTREQQNSLNLSLEEGFITQFHSRDNLDEPPPPIQ